MTDVEDLFRRVQPPLTRAIAQAVHDALLEHGDQTASGPALATVLAGALAAVFAGVVQALRKKGQLGWDDAEVSRVFADVLDLALQSDLARKPPPREAAH